MSNSVSFYKAAATRAAARERLLKGLPLEEVDMTIPIVLEDLLSDNASFPPHRLSKKHQRLLVYDRLYKGDITDFVSDITAANNVPNFFERIPTVIMSLMLASDPVVPREELLAMQAYLGACILDGFKTGRGYLVRAGDQIWSPNTSTVYNGADGEIYIISVGTSPEAQSPDPDYADVWRVDENLAIKWRQKYAYGNLGEIIIPPVGIEGTYAVADRPPAQDGWGKSMYDSLIAPVVGMSLRISGNERIIEKNLHPITTYGMSISDVALFGSQGSPQQRRQGEVDLAQFQQVLVDAIDEDLLLVPTGSELNKLEWGASAMSAAFQMVDMFEKLLSAMSGLPMDVLNGEMEAASGVALDRWLIALYAETRMFFNVLHAAAEKVRGAEFEWTNFFTDNDDPAEPPAIAPTPPVMMIEGADDGSVDSEPA